MKNIKTTLLLTIIILGFFKQEKLIAKTNDTLNHFNKNSIEKIYYDKKLCSFGNRFVITDPIKINKIEFSVFNRNILGSLKLHIYGYEGGLSAPLISKEIITPIKFEISKQGKNKLSIELKESLLIDVNQFFVIIDSLSEGLFLISDYEEKYPECISSDDREYFYQVMMDKDGIWTYGKYAFDISVIYNDLEKENENYFELINSKDNGIKDKLSHNKCISLCDFNSDGLIDVVVDGKLYINNNNFNFSNFKIESRSDLSPQFNCTLDLNNDGLTDIVFLGTKDSSAINQNLFGKVFIQQTSGSLVESKLTNIPNITTPLSYTITDINGDGYDDIIINYLVNNEKEFSNVVLINDKKNGFNQINNAILENDNFFKNQYNLQAIDVNNDRENEIFLNKKNGDLRIFKFNKFQNHYDDITNNLYKEKDWNRENKNNSIIGYGSDWFDINNDGYLDLLITECEYIENGQKELEIQPNTRIFINQGPPNYQMQNLLGKFEFKEEIRGCKFGDLNNDGLIDFLTASGCNCISPDIYVQDFKNNFKKISFHTGLEGFSLGEDFLLADLNNDGMLDIITVENSQVEIFKNVLPKTNNFLEINIGIGEKNENLIGGSVIVYDNNGETYIQKIAKTNGILVQKDIFLHIGLNKASRIDSLKIFDKYHKLFSKYTDMKVNNMLHINNNGINENGKKVANMKITIQPNPFKNKVVINYYLEQTSEIIINILNINGELINQWHEFHEIGDNKFEWNALDKNYLVVPDGLYYFILKINGREEIIKAIKL